MPATVILNPYSNRWKAREQAPEVEELLHKAGIEHDFQISEHPKQAIELARTAVQKGNTPLIAAGGDGGISEVVNGIMQATSLDNLPAGPLGLIPLGTANDITDMLNIPRDLGEAVQIIKAGHTRTIDLGKVNNHYFDNNSAVGLEPVVSIENIRLTWLKGVIRYLASAAIAIMKHPTWDAKLEWDDGNYKGSITLISVGNSRRTGGVFFMTPDAKLDDGLLDFIFAPTLGRLRLFQLLPKTQTGEHINDSDIHVHKTTRLAIHTNPPTPIQADGELIETEASEIIYQVLPGALQVFSPRI